MCNEKKPAANDVVGACPECGFDITAAELAIDGMCDHCQREKDEATGGFCNCCHENINLDGSCGCDSIEEDDDSDGEYFYPYERH